MPNLGVSEWDAFDIAAYLYVTGRPERTDAFRRRESLHSSEHTLAAGPPALPAFKFRPGPRIHIPQDRFVPGVIGMRSEVGGGFEVPAAGVAEGGGERHFLGAGGVGYLILDGADGRVGALPGRHAARRNLDVPA